MMNYTNGLYYLLSIYSKDNVPFCLQLNCKKLKNEVLKKIYN